MNVVISQAAAEDLARIRRWIDGRHGEDAAALFEQRAEAALRDLSTHPRMGPRPHWSTRHAALRFWVVTRTRYLVFYEVAGRTVSIERVLDGRRDIRRVIEDGLEDPPAQD